MRMSAMAYQRQLDEAGDLANQAERLEQDCRETLNHLEPWHYVDSVSWMCTKWKSIGDEELNYALIGECLEDLKLAAALLDSNPVEAMRMLDECRGKAVEDVLGRMDFEAIVKADQKQEDAA